MEKLTNHILPEEILDLSNLELISNIKDIKQKSGKNLLILGHHYQRQEIVHLSDFKGDSLELARLTSTQKNARDIVFCGVHFMAESAAILCEAYQRVFLPEISAGCPMADMTEPNDLFLAWERLTSIVNEDHLVPICYMNSKAEVKAFCGEKGGSICTSSNAALIFKKVISEGKKIFFMPDRHLGQNSANFLKIPKEKIVIYNPHEGDNLSKKQILEAAVILWDGFCHVHTFFNPTHIKKARKRFPEGKIIVHPECPEEVVNQADENGSTSFIEKYVKKAQKGSTIIIGTELNFVSRLAKEHPDKKIYELARSICPNMYKTNLQNLYYTLLNLNNIKPIKISTNIKNNAKIALKNMLSWV
jgi:quinolinate synthase